MAKELLVEERLDLSFVIPGCYGTGDMVGLDFDNEEIISADLKWGRGVRVTAYGNKQPRAYALAAYRTYEQLADWKTVRMVIIQPRVDGGISEEVISIDELLEFERELLAGWEAALADNAPRNPGEYQCKFCKAQGECPAAARQIIDLFDTYPDVDVLSNEEIAVLLPRVNQIQDWASAIKQKAYNELAQGNTIPGYKLVPGKRGPRKWTNETQAAQILKGCLDDQDLFVRKIISPPQVQKKVDADTWGRLENLIVQSEAQPVLASDSDKRPAVEPELSFDTL
jgi:hypothetical protein